MFDDIFPKRFTKDSLGVMVDNDLHRDDKITDFYDVAPFPNYKNNQSISELINTGRSNLFISQIVRLLKPGDKFLEAGCGTGQVTNFLAASTNATIFGSDLTYESLKLGAEFRNKNNLANAHFIRHNILQSPLPENYFDYVWCSGVLHHTPDPYGGYVKLLSSLKPGGLIFIGLYNKYARIRTVFRQKLYQFGPIGKRVVRSLDPVMRACANDNEKLKAWERDQYIHPRESLHTVDEVKDWFKQHGVDYISSVPRLDFANLNQPHFLQKEESRSNAFYRAAQLALLFENIGSEGGLIVHVGQKNEV